MERIPLKMADTPHITPVIEGEVWRLLDDFSASINGYTITVPKGFITDGASIPRLLWRICGHPMTTRRFPIALIHDWIYTEYEDLPLTRKDADRIYHDGLRDLGFPEWMAWLEWAAIRLFGGKHWESPDE